MHEFAQKYQSIKDVYTFLTEEHALYTASKLVERAQAPAASSEASELVKKSYGGGVAASRRLQSNNPIQRVAASLLQLDRLR